MLRNSFLLMFSPYIVSKIGTILYLCCCYQTTIMEAKAKFNIIYSEESIKFLNSLDEKTKAKIMYNVNKSKYVIDKELFKKLDDANDIWEFRTLYNGGSYRLFAFWDTDKETLVITTHGIIKKNQKTPPKEIAKAKEIRKIYFSSKK